MLSGKLPFEIQDRSVSALLLTGKLPPVQWGCVSELQQNLIMQCLSVNMRDRPPAMELMKHPALYDASEVHRLDGSSSRSRSSSQEKKRGSVESRRSFFVLLPSC